MEIEKFLKEKKQDEKTPIERLICKDGFSMSVQNGAFAYCDEYSAEIGYPSEIEPLILCYAEDQREPTGTIYPYVPLDEIEAVIQKHGGLQEYHKNDEELQSFMEFMMKRFMRKD